MNKKGISECDICSKLITPAIKKTVHDVPDIDKETKPSTTLRHLKTNVGTALNRALEALEDTSIDAVQDVLSFSKVS